MRRKKIRRKKISADYNQDNGKMWTVSRKLAKIWTFSRKKP